MLKRVHDRLATNLQKVIAGYHAKRALAPLNDHVNTRSGVSCKLLGQLSKGLDEIIGGQGSGAQVIQSAPPFVQRGFAETQSTSQGLFSRKISRQKFVANFNLQ